MSTLSEDIITALNKKKNNKVEEAEFKTEEAEFKAEMEVKINLEENHTLNSNLSNKTQMSRLSEDVIAGLKKKKNDEVETKAEVEVKINLEENYTLISDLSKKARKILTGFHFVETDNISSIQNGYTPLRCILQAIRCKDPNGYKALSEILNYDIDLNFGVVETPLMYACRYLSISVIKILIRKGAKINFNFNGKTPLSEAVEKGRHDVISFLVENGANFLISNGFFANVLINTIHDPDPRDDINNIGVATIKQLLSLGIKVNWGIKVNQTHFIGYVTPLSCAKDKASYYEKYPQEQINNGATQKQSDNARAVIAAKIALLESAEMLFLVAGTNDIAKAASLLEQGASVHQRNFDGLTPLHFACLSHQPEMVTFLIKNGANLLALDDKDNTPIHYLTSDLCQAALLGQPDLRSRNGMPSILDAVLAFNDKMQGMILKAIKNEIFKIVTALDKLPRAVLNSCILGYLDCIYATTNAGNKLIEKCIDEFFLVQNDDKPNKEQSLIPVNNSINQVSNNIPSSSLTRNLRQPWLNSLALKGENSNTNNSAPTQDKKESEMDTVEPFNWSINLHRNKVNTNTNSNQGSPGEETRVLESKHESSNKKSNSFKNG